MSFIVYDLIFLGVFCLFLIIFLYKRRKRLKKEGILLLYKTQVGVKLIDYIGKKYKKFLNALSWIIIISGYVLMVFMLYLLGQLIYLFLKIPNFAGLVKIPPLAPLIPYLPQLFKADYLPMFYFTYWIIVLALVSVVHEFSHGIYAKLNGVNVKSTGFFFLGPFFGAFVEPDEKKVEKLKAKEQITMLSAGTFSNLVLTILFFIFLWLFFISTFTASGVIFNTYTYHIVNKTDITSFGKNITVDFDGGLNLTEISVGNKTDFILTEEIANLNSTQQVLVFDDSPALKAGLSGIIISLNDVKIKDYTALGEELSKYKPGYNVTIKTLQNNKEKDYNITLGENPENKKAYIGIGILQYQTSLLGKIRAKLTFFKDPNTYYTPKAFSDFTNFIYYLLWWIALINLSVALSNMLPLGIFDGGRVFYVTMLWITKSKSIAKKAFSFATYAILLIFAFLMLTWFFSFFNII